MYYMTLYNMLFNMKQHKLLFPNFSLCEIQIFKHCIGFGVFSAPPQTERQEYGTVPSNSIVLQSPAVIHLLSLVDQPLLVHRHPSFIGDLPLELSDGLSWRDIVCARLALFIL